MKNIKLIILDNDGVLTDGTIAYDNKRIETKNFSAKDGLGIKLLRFTDIEIAVITGRKSEILAQRCEDLDIKYLFQKISNKLDVARNLLKQLELNWENVAYLGDDWNDLPVMKHAAFTGCPSDAFSLFKKEVDYICERCGGKGAVREFIEYILSKQCILQETISKFVKQLETE